MTVGWNDVEHSGSNMFAQRFELAIGMYVAHHESTGTVEVQYGLHFSQDCGCLAIWDWADGTETDVP